MKYPRADKYIKFKIPVEILIEMDDKQKKEVQEEAYRRAAIATVRKLDEVMNKPIFKMLVDIGKYEGYLIKTYKI